MHLILLERMFVSNLPLLTVAPVHALYFINMDAILKEDKPFSVSM